MRIGDLVARKGEPGPQIRIVGEGAEAAAVVANGPSEVAREVPTLGHAPGDRGGTTTRVPNRFITFGRPKKVRTCFGRVRSGLQPGPVCGVGFGQEVCAVRRRRAGECCREHEWDHGSPSCLRTRFSASAIRASPVCSGEGAKRATSAALRNASHSATDSALARASRSLRLRASGVRRRPGNSYLSDRYAETLQTTAAGSAGGCRASECRVRSAARAARLRRRRANRAPPGLRSRHTPHHPSATTGGTAAAVHQTQGGTSSDDARDGSVMKSGTSSGTTGIGGGATLRTWIVIGSVRALRNGKSGLSGGWGS